MRANADNEILRICPRISLDFGPSLNLASSTVPQKKAFNRMTILQVAVSYRVVAEVLSAGNHS
jgi:hypothetical protein